MKLQICFSFNYINPASFRPFLKHAFIYLYLTQMSSVYCICIAQLSYQNYCKTNWSYKKFSLIYVKM